MIIIDDVVSTTDTCNIILNEFKKKGVKTVAILAIVVKGHDYLNLIKTHKVPVHSILIRMDNGNVDLGP
ncbi:MAG: hypothetical protein HZB92_02605 [Euryarchaeota archaeon]|nr:hypothetical protein [Euryarchaeota archaeon]